MKASWILVADSCRARIFTADTPSSALREIEDFAHAEGRLHEQSMTSDLSGRDPGLGGTGGHPYDDKTGPKKQEAVTFAKRIARHLDEAHNERKFDQLLVISEPSFLGKLRNEFSDQVRNVICFELDKNITQHNAGEIRRQLPEFLPSL
ncbi:MAG: host attachment protein [Gammaproteobacteria bacterium]